MTRPANPKLVNELLNITTDLIIARGARNVTMREIAGLAGVTPTTIHYYFGDKRGLFEATRLRAIAELDAAVDVSIDASADAVTQLRQVATAFFGWSVANPQGFALVFDALPSMVEPTELSTRPYYATLVRLQEVLQGGLERGELDCHDAQARAAVGFATLFGLADLYINQRLPPQYLADPAALVEDALLVLLDSCAAAPVVPLALAPVVPLTLAPVVPISGPRALSDDDLEGLAAAGPEPCEPGPPGGPFSPDDHR
ncbi:MAG: TetR/AcrR family transcriptional regulator [Actinomycetes bacterium]